MKVAIGGARRLPPGTAFRVLIRFMANLDPDTIVLLRRGLNTDPGPFEMDVAELCTFLGLDVQWRRPKPDDINPGRQSVFVRDFDMVAEADLTLVFVPDIEPLDSSGTAHLMDKAIELNKAVFAYTVSDDGTTTRYGENDPDDLYAALVEG